MKLPAVTEREFQTQVLVLAKHLGWRRIHLRPARTLKGWRTPVEGDGKGFPDSLMLRGPRIIVAELKRSPDEELTLEQAAWLAAFTAAGVPAFVWSPEDWDEIEATLK